MTCFPIRDRISHSLSSFTEKLLTIARLLTAEYYIVLALTPEGNYGKGRYALRLVAPTLAAGAAYLPWAVVVAGQVSAQRGAWW